jgi:Tol biopolymer transport system component
VVTARDFPGDDTLSFSALAFPPDGQRLAYVRTTTRSLATVWISPAPGGAPVRLSAGEDFQLGPTWSPDGNTIAFMSAMADGLAEIALGSTGAPVALGKHVCEDPARWSPDGQWIVCPNRGELTLISLDGSRSRSLGNHRFWAAAWSKDSQQLFAIERSATRSQLVSIDNATGSEKTLLDLGTVSLSAAGNGATLSLSADGNSITTAVATVRSDVWLLTGFPQPHSWLRRLWLG